MANIVVSESYDKHYIYIDDDDADEREVIINFIDKYDDAVKAKILREIADWLEKKNSLPLASEGKGSV